MEPRSPALWADSLPGEPQGKPKNTGVGDLNKIAESGKVDYKKDFFEKPASLTVSGQLNVETYAMAFSNVYTFGPTFRAERSNTPRHASEFWMIEDIER